MIFLRPVHLAVRLGAVLSNFKVIFRMCLLLALSTLLCVPCVLSQVAFKSVCRGASFALKRPFVGVHSFFVCFQLLRPLARDVALVALERSRAVLSELVLLQKTGPLELFAALATSVPTRHIDAVERPLMPQKTVVQRETLTANVTLVVRGLCVGLFMLVPMTEVFEAVTADAASVRTLVDVNSHMLFQLRRKAPNGAASIEWAGKRRLNE